MARLDDILLIMISNACLECIAPSRPHCNTISSSSTNQYFSLSLLELLLGIPNIMLPALRILRLPAGKLLVHSYVSTTQNPARLKLLKIIYAPFAQLSENSIEYRRLAKSGDCWYNYFESGNIERYGYDKLQRVWQTPVSIFYRSVLFADVSKDRRNTLEEIDGVASALKISASTVAQTLVAEYSHQSTKIERNSLELSDSMTITEMLENNLFQHVD